MGIHGVTGGAGRLPEIGRLTKGGGKQGDGKIGKDLKDEFRFVPADDVSAAMWASVMGDGPLKQIEIQLMYPEPEGNFEAWREMWYSNGGLNRRCEGEAGKPCLSAFDQRGQAIELTCSFPNCATDGKGRQLSCKASGRFRVMVPALMEVGMLGELLVLTTSVADCRHIDSVLSVMRQNLPTLRGVRFMMSRKPAMMKGPTGMKEQWLIRLTPVPQPLGHPALAGAASARNLPPPEYLDHDEDDDESVIEADVSPRDRAEMSIAEAENVSSGERVAAGKALDKMTDAEIVNGQDVPWDDMEGRPAASKVDDVVDGWVIEMQKLVAGYTKADGDELVLVGQTQSLAIELSNMWDSGDPDTNRHLLLAQLFGVDSSKKLTRRQYTGLKLNLSKPDARHAINSIVNDAAVPA